MAYKILFDMVGDDLLRRGSISKWDGWNKNKTVEGMKNSVTIELFKFSNSEFVRWPEWQMVKR